MPRGLKYFKKLSCCMIIFHGICSLNSPLIFISLKGIIKPPNDNTKVYAAVGSAAALPCVFSADLVPSLPVWQKLQPGSLFKPAPGRLPSSFSPSSQSSQLAWDKSASLKEVEFKDEGRYRCSGTVQGQRLSRNIQLVVAKSKITWIQFKLE